MVVPTNSHEEARRETSYILPFPARSLSFCAGIALANMVGGAGGGRLVTSSLIFPSLLMVLSRDESRLLSGLVVPKEPTIARIEPKGTGLRGQELK